MSGQVEISKRLVAVNAGSALAAKVINLGVLVWLQQYLLTRISPEEYALYPVLMAIMICVPLLTSIFTAGLGRYIVEAYARGDNRHVTEIFSTMLPPLCTAGLVVAAGGLLLAWNVEHVLQIDAAYIGDARLMLALLMVSAAVSVPGAALSVGLYVRQKFLLRNAITLAGEGLRIALLFVLLCGISPRVYWVVVATVAGNLAALIAMIVVSLRLVPALRVRWSAVRWPLLPKLLGFGGWNFLSQAAHTLRGAADPLILNRWGSALDVTCFHLGSLPDRHMRQGAGLAALSLQPPLTAMHATGDSGRLGRAYVRLSRYGLWLGLAVGLPLAVFAHEVVTLYVGAEYLAAATVMALLLSLLPFAYANMSLLNVAIARAEMRTFTIYGMIHHVANLALAIYLVRGLGWGAPGVALAYFVTGLGAQPFFVRLGVRMTGIGWRAWCYGVLWRGLVPGLASGPVLLALKYALQPADWIVLGACVAAGLAVYAVTLLALFDAGERADLQAVRRRLLGGRASGAVAAAPGASVAAGTRMGGLPNGAD